MLHHRLLLFDRYFFSSRRRHTRCYRDWSSDVCSSDLSTRRSSWAQARRSGRWWMAESSTPARRLAFSCKVAARSEERRVGKEGRARGWGEADRKECAYERSVHTALRF